MKKKENKKMLSLSMMVLEERGQPEKERAVPSRKHRNLKLYLRGRAKKKFAWANVLFVILVRGVGQGGGRRKTWSVQRPSHHVQPWYTAEHVCRRPSQWRIFKMRRISKDSFVLSIALPLSQFFLMYVLLNLWSLRIFALRSFFALVAWVYQMSFI